MKRNCSVRATSILMAALFLLPLGASFSAPFAVAANETAKPVLPPPDPSKWGPPEAGDFVLLYDKAADLYIDAADWEGAAIALSSLQSDIELVGGKKPQIVNDPAALNGMSVLVGTIGKSAVIDKLIAGQKIDVSAVKGKWESYVLDVVENPVDGVERALVVAGSDKRGTIYGIYKISEMIGVSPWIWWADSFPEPKSTLAFPGDLRIEQGEPSVKYRGIFLNDEAPSLSGWVSSKFGKDDPARGTKGYNSQFYTKVFELLLRLKGNYLWPAMWNNAFHIDDPQNTVLADSYGIVMGTTHQEHMTCADKEWSWANLGEWNYFTNRDNVYRFWQDGVSARKPYESVLTLGMRGQGDTSILGSGATLGDNMALLDGVLKDQRQIIKDVYGKPDAVPQLIALYKEVEDYYYGNSSYGSLAVPDDVTLLLCDDNFGNVRTLPTEEMLGRSGGFGMYYHFDYRGGPISYEWINQTPLTKVWEQMTMAYDAGVQEIWIVNVGDLKPMELPIDYFLNLAYDYAQWSPVNKVEEFTRAFAAREFGEDFAEEGAEVLDGYTAILGARKAELVLPNPSTFGLTAFDEADRVLRGFESVVSLAESVYERLPDYKKDVFYELALYPARAAMNVYKANICAAWSQYYAAEGLPVANSYARLSSDAFDADALEMDYYNYVVAGGKWNGIMRQNHIGYTSWDGPSTGVVASQKPRTATVEVQDGSEMVLRPQYSDVFLRDGGEGLLSPFTLVRGTDDSDSYDALIRYIDILNAKGTPFAFTAKTDADWLELGMTEGVCIEQARLEVRVKGTQALQNPPSQAAIITISGAGAEMKVTVRCDIIAQTLARNVYVETGGFVSINAARTTATGGAGGAEWTTLDGYGREGDLLLRRDGMVDALKVLPNGKQFTPDGDAPYAEYSFFLQSPGTYHINTYIAPTNNAVHKSDTPLTNQLRFSTQVDGGARQTVSGLLDPQFAVSGGLWGNGVLNNTRMVPTGPFDLEEGLHTLRVYAVDPGVVLQRFVIAPSDVKEVSITNAPQAYHLMGAYFGPPESLYAGQALNISSLNYVALTEGIKQFAVADKEIRFLLEDGTVFGTAKALADNGGTLTEWDIANVGVPTKPDHEFLGWVTAGGLLVTQDVIFTEPTDLFASFLSNANANISYHPNGGTGTTAQTPARVGETVTVGDCTFTHADAHFAHWNTKPDDSGNVYSPGVSYTADAPATLYAIWSDEAPASTASSEAADGRLTNAFDGDPATAWKLLGTAGEWIEFSLSKAVTLDSLTVDEDGDYIGIYEVLAWNNAQNVWEVVLEGEGIGAKRELLFFQAKAVTTDKLRLHIMTAAAPPVIRDILLAPFQNHALAANGGEITAVPDGGEGEPDTMIDGDRLDYTKRWRFDSQTGFADPVTLMLSGPQSIAAVNIFSISGLWNEEPKDIFRDTVGTNACGTIRNLSLEYTEDGSTWQPLPGGQIRENELSWIAVKLDAPLTMRGLRFTAGAQTGGGVSDNWIRVVEFEVLEAVDTKGLVLLPGPVRPAMLSDAEPSDEAEASAAPDAETEPGGDDGKKKDRKVLIVVIVLSALAVVAAVVFAVLWWRRGRAGAKAPGQSKNKAAHTTETASGSTEQEPKNNTKSDS